MGGGSWTRDAFTSYVTSSYTGVTANSISMDGSIDTSLNTQDIYQSRKLDKCLNPYNVMRECRDSAEHPRTVPIILALDVTGSMGDAAVEVAKKINVIITNLYKKYKDIEFMIMGLGDLAYDDAPIQMSQFESDIRILEQGDKVYFEGGGGGNAYESYTAAWYMGAYHTDLDCWKRGKKGIIITLGDEQLNPYLPADELSRVTGDDLQADVETTELYNIVKEKYNIYHIQVQHRKWVDTAIPTTFKRVIPEENYFQSDLQSVSDTIVHIIDDAMDLEASTNTEGAILNEDGTIGW